MPQYFECEKCGKRGPTFDFYGEHDCTPSLERRTAEARAILADAWKRVQALGFTINYNRDPGGSMAGDVESEIARSESIILRPRK